MTVESQEHRPNEHGFSGAATAPDPERRPEPVEKVEGESIAVPAGDITGAVSAAIEDATTSDDDR
ncbi:hypothetical protein [Couchioplanes caeruleus]|uniref:Uncharacterized protein n=2 Tax=Couchioplanes caeruleus TaxID=56438 RepID=A0A1K0FSE7_9ACTN|nr:hypothetical protein [Couchioplanes caeruleus]OJF15733.1 hypothetical protein BG844_03135 [Couchioplanes caeruleus subsp. caeruleus]ROP31872.1 hypothetical protein EDD30_4799 [Couchioplanes caeruleus]